MTLGVNFRPFSGQSLDKEQLNSTLELLTFYFKFKQTFVSLKSQV